jgi:hypothetical protein
MNDKARHLLFNEYKHKNVQDILALALDLDEDEFLRILENADGRKIIVDEHPDFKGKMVCDPPLVWRYGRRYVSLEEKHERQVKQWETLLESYCKRHDNGKEVGGVLLYSFSLTDGIRILKKAGGRRVIVKSIPGVIDGVECSYD